MDTFYQLQKEIQFAVILSDSFHEFTEKCGEITDDIQKFYNWGDLSHEEMKTLSALLMVQMVGVKAVQESAQAAQILAPIFRNDYPENE